MGPCRVRTVRAPEELRWTSRFLIPGLLDADHRFQVVAEAPGRTRLDQYESFRGVLIPVGGGILEQVRQSLDALGEALRARAEACP